MASPRLLVAIFSIAILFVALPNEAQAYESITRNDKYDNVDQFVSSIDSDLQQQHYGLASWPTRKRRPHSRVDTEKQCKPGSYLVCFPDGCRCLRLPWDPEALG